MIFKTEQSATAKPLVYLPKPIVIIANKPLRFKKVLKVAHQPQPVLLAENVFYADEFMQIVAHSE